MHSGYTFVLSVCVFPGNRTHNLCAANAMLSTEPREHINQEDRVKLSQGLHLSNLICLKAVKGDIQNVCCCGVSKEGVILRVQKNPNNVLS